MVHFNSNIKEGIKQYERRIARFKKIIQEDKKIYFLYINEDYLYNEKYRDKQINDDIFLQMLDLELYIKKTYPKINYTILYFNFVKHTIPEDSNIVNIVLNTNKLYENGDTAPYNKFRQYCGLLLSKIFKSEFTMNYTSKIFNDL